MSLVTIAEFKQQLGLTGFVTDDGLLQMKLDHATFLVLRYITRSNDTAQADEIASWSSDPEPGSPAQVAVPFDVHAGILQWATELYRFRGDDVEDPPRDAPGDPSKSVKSILWARRRQVFA